MKPVTLLQGLAFPDFGLGRFFTSEKPGGLISHSWAEFHCEILPPGFEARNVEHTFQSFTSRPTEATRRHPKEHPSKVTFSYAQSLPRTLSKRRSVIEVRHIYQSSKSSVLHAAKDALSEKGREVVVESHQFSELAFRQRMRREKSRLKTQPNLDHTFNCFLLGHRCKH